MGYRILGNGNDFFEAYKEKKAWWRIQKEWKSWTLYGRNGNDTLIGGPKNDELHGEEDSDTLYGWFGHDTLYGDNGDDLLYGDADNDILYGWFGHDNLYGGDGNDLLYGDADNDGLYGGTGNDILYGGANNDFLLGHSDDDILDGGWHNDILDGWSGDDTLIGGSGADSFQYWFLQEGIDTIKDFKYWEGDKIFIEMNTFLDTVPNISGSVSHSQFTFDFNTRRLFFLDIHFATLENISSPSDFIVSRDISIVDVAGLIFG